MSLGHFACRGDDREIVLKNAPVPFKIINPAIADNIKQEFIKGNCTIY